MIKFDLSDIPIAPRQYQMAGIILLSVGVVLLILGLVFSIMTDGRREAHQNRVKVSGEECAARIRDLGLQPELTDKMITIKAGDLTQGMALLAKSSQASSLCPSWVLAYYCLGEACDPPGLNMRLQYQEPQ